MANRKLSKTEKFTELFDNSWNKNRSTIRTKLQNDRSYDPTYSWEARCDNPNSFTRLQATEMPVQPSNPITLSGAAVVRLEKDGDGLEVFNCPLPRNPGSIPLTCGQQELGMVPDLTGSIPIFENARNKNKYLVVEKMPGFRNMQLQPTVLKEVDIPNCLLEAGPQCDRRLLSVQERRQIFEFEKNKKEAESLMKSAVMERDKTRKLLEGQQYHRGVLMLDSNRNEQSEIYGDRAQVQHSRQRIEEMRRIERQSRIADKTSSLLSSGNILVPETLHSNVKVNKDFRTKGGNYHNLSFEETYDRLFNRQAGGSDPTRTQRLRDLEAGNKNYNIVTHTTIEQWPPRQIERLENRHMNHPSQTALEGSRNLQGTLRPY